ncbi:MAG: GNAT family N-acetyltransferase [Bacteroidia bacterium]|nr:GNAT family N-acetyltransferase [Bacteroidia bacterium]
MCQDEFEKIDKNQWAELLKSSSHRSFFQSPECYGLYKAMSFMTPFVYAVSNQSALKGVIVGYVQKDGGAIKSFLSRRAIINGGPLVADDITSDEFKELLITCRKGLKVKAIYVETRNFEDYSTYKTLFEECGFKYVPHLNFHIDTSSMEVVESNMGKSRKRDIRVSFRDGASVVDDPSDEQVVEFYAVLEQLYRTRVKTPLYPLSFFQYLAKQDYARFLLVEYGGHIVGGTVCVCLPEYAVYEWFACGEDGVHKNIFPSTVATYSGIKYAAENGYGHFDMMGAGSPDKGYGVRDFKAKFGGVLVEHGRFRNVLNPALYGVGKLGVAVMKGELSKQLRGGQIRLIDYWRRLWPRKKDGGIAADDDKP